MKRNYWKAWKAIPVAFLLTACATVPMTSETLDTAGKSFSVPPDKANIYVVRTSALGSAVLIELIFDGKNVGSLATKTYHLLTVEPGQHTVAVSTLEGRGHVILNAEVGESYFLDAEPEMGWISAKVSIRMLGKEEGHKKVLAAKRAETLPF